MKRIVAMSLAAVALAGLAAPTANEDFVIAEDAKTYTNAVRYTDAATNGLPRFADIEGATNGLPTFADIESATNGLLRTETDPTVPAWAKAENPPASGLTTDDVQAIVTNETAEFTAWVPNVITEHSVRPPVWLEFREDEYPNAYAESPSELPYGGAWDHGWQESPMYDYKDKFARVLYGQIDGVDVTYTRTRLNALGLARLSDLPALTNGLLRAETDPTIYNWAKAAAKPSYTAGEVGAYSASAGANLASVVNTWETYWDGDEVRVTVTNYDSAVHLPSLYLEQKVEDSDEYQVVWSESTRWASNAVDMAAIRSALDDKADRAWGFYDSHTGNYAPDGYTWLSSPKIAIAGGLAYQRTLTTDGAVWVLVSNGMVAQTNGDDENGFFRIKDDEGNTTFEIVRGNKRTVGATAAGIKVVSSGGTHTVTVPYNVVSESAPTMYGATTLDGEWSQLSPTWTGGSGAWTGVVTSASSSLFIKGEYETGGETYIRNAAPISVDGGLYATNTASGGFVKIRPKWNGSTVTWERVQ